MRTGLGLYNAYGFLIDTVADAQLPLVPQYITCGKRFDGYYLDDKLYCYDSDQLVGWKPLHCNKCIKMKGQSHACWPNIISKLSPSDLNAHTHRQRTFSRLNS